MFYRRGHHILSARHKHIIRFISAPALNPGKISVFLTQFDFMCLQQLFRMIRHISSISPELIVSGGAMRRQWEANKNQSVSRPFRIQASMIRLLVSKFSKPTAIKSPAVRTNFMEG